MSNNIIERSFKYQEFVKFVKETPNHKSNSRLKKSEDTEDKVWSGSENFNESLEWAESGWDSGLKQLELEQGILTGTGMEVSPSMQGSLVNIGNYLNGLPNNMWEFTEEREFNLDPLTVYVPMGYTSSSDGLKAMEFCKKTIKYINVLQSKFNTRVISVQLTNLRAQGKIICTQVLLKDYDERFVLNNIAFAFQPSFFRRLYFKYLETIANMCSGYGSSARTPQILNYIESSRKDTDRSILIPSLNDVIGSGEYFTKQMEIMGFSPNLKEIEDEASKL